jgi:hypothetical protein
VETAGDNTGRCWRCGGEFASTTEDDFRRCTGLARTTEAEEDNPLHYSDEEAIESWAGDVANLWEWLHLRAAGQDDPR